MTEINQQCQFRIAVCKRPQGFDRARLYNSDDFTEKSVYGWNPKTGQTQTIPVKAEGHAVINSPIDSSISVICPRFSETASLVNWRMSSESEQFKLELNQYFYGHGAFSENGQQILFSGVESKNQQLSPRLFLFQLGVSSPRKVIEFNFGYPHDILNLYGNVFLVSSGSKTGEGQFVLFDLDQNRFEPIKVQSDTEYSVKGTSLVHLKRFNDVVYGNLQYINDKSSDFLGRGCIARLDLKTLQANLEFPPIFDFINSEILSLEVDPLRKRLWGTLPAQKKVFVWSLITKEMLKVVSFSDIVTSISYVSQYDRMLCGQYKNLVFLNCENFNFCDEESSLLAGLQEFSDKYFAHSSIEK